MKYLLSLLILISQILPAQTTCENWMMQKTKKKVGTIFTDQFKRASLGATYTVTGTGAYSCDGSKLIAKSTGNLDISYNYSTASENWYMSCEFSTTSVNISDRGVGIGMRSASRDFSFNYILSSAPSITSLLSWNNRIGPITNYGSGLPCYANDHYKLEVTNKRWDLYIKVTNLTHGGFEDWSWTLNPDNVDWGYATALPTLFFYNSVENIQVYDFTYVDNNIIGTKTVFIGNSITHGQKLTTIANRFANLVYDQNTNFYSVYAGPGDNSSQIPARLDEIYRAKPKYAVVDLGSNIDGAFPTSMTTILTNLKAHNIIPIVLSIAPRNDHDVTANNLQLQTVCTTLSCKLIDVYNDLFGGSALSAMYDAGDGIHWNSAGHLVVKNRILAEAPEIKGGQGVPPPAPDTLRISQTSDAFSIVVTGQGSFLVKWGDGNTNNYTLSYYSATTISHTYSTQLGQAKTIKLTGILNKITSLSYTSGDASFSINQLTGLVSLTLVGLNGCTGNPALLTRLAYLNLGGYFAGAGDITSLNLGSLIIGNQAANRNVVGDITGWTNCWYFSVPNTNDFYGSWSNKPKITTITSYSTLAWTGSLTGYTNLTTVSLASANAGTTVGADLSTLTNLTVLLAGSAANTQWAGDISNLTKLTNLTINGNTCSGSPDLLTKLTIWSVGGNNTITPFTNLTAMTGLSNFVACPNWVLTSAQVNQYLADFWANKDVAKSRGDRVINLLGNASSQGPIGQGITDKTSLQGYKTPNNTGPVVWTVTTR